MHVSAYRHGHWQAARLAGLAIASGLISNLHVLPLKTREDRLHLVENPFLPFVHCSWICERKFVPCVPIGATSTGRCGRANGGGNRGGHGRTIAVGISVAEIETPLSNGTSGSVIGGCDPTAQRDLRL